MLTDLLWNATILYGTITIINVLFHTDIGLDQLFFMIHQNVEERYFELIETDSFKKIQKIYDNAASKYSIMVKKINDIIQINTKKDKKKVAIEEAKPLVKFEDKYLEEIRKLANDFILTVEEDQLKQTVYHKYFEDTLNDLYNRVEIIKKEIKEIHYDKDLMEEYITDVGDTNTNTNKTKRSDSKTAELLILEEELHDIETKLANKNKLNEEAENYASHFVIKKRLENMKHNFVMEHTPLGNVVMFYNEERETFSFFSDNNIPYRYLEPVARKYVMTFHCKPLYVDMEHELKEAERKLKEKEKEMKEKKENSTSNKDAKPEIKKKNVFAQFKTYNKEAGSGRVNVAPPPKNSIPNKNNISGSKNENEPVLLKDRANRYTYEGRLCNFQVTQKISRKKVDKRYATTFAEFKAKMSKK